METSKGNRVKDVNRAIDWVNNLFSNEEQYGENWERYRKGCHLGGNKSFSFIFAYNDSFLAIVIDCTVYIAWEDNGMFCHYRENSPFSFCTHFTSDLIDVLNRVQDYLPKVGEPVYFEGSKTICQFGYDSDKEIED